MHRHPTAFVLASLLAAGCGADTPQAASPPGAPAPPAAAAKGTCTTKEACYEAGRKAEMANNANGAKGFYTTGCELGDGESCNEVAVKFADPAQKAALGQKACELGSGAGCFNLAEEARKAAKEKEAIALYEKSCSGSWRTLNAKPVACRRGSISAFRAGDVEAAARMAQASCTEEFSEGCGVLGVLYVQGKGVAADDAKGRALLHRACEARDEDACANEKKLGAPAAPSDVAGSNVSIASMAIEGVTITDMVCNTGKLAGPATGSAAATSLAKKKPALDACAPKGARARIRWTVAGGKVSQAEAKSGDDKVDACVAKAVKSLAGAPDAVCAATLELGKAKLTLSHHRAPAPPAPRSPAPPAPPRPQRLARPRPPRPPPKGAAHQLVGA